MQTQHTPGPWSVSGAGILNHPVTNRPVSTVQIEAAGWGRIGDWYDESNEGPGNVRLIAAAPELLAALQVIAVWLIAPVTDPSTLAWVQAAARAAIDTATGRTL